MNPPILSVIIPAFNREAYLTEALDSVLHQTRPADEIIVIDDGSTDRTAEVARAYGERVRCISQANQGIGGARNAGVASARGDLIAFLDSDDRWAPHKLERQCLELAERPDLHAVFCQTKLFLSPEIAPDQAPAFDPREQDACLPSGLLARRQLFVQTGPFDTALRGGDFICWFGRAKENGVRFHVVPEVLYTRRVHAGNSVHEAATRIDYLHVLKRQLDRRRAALIKG